MYSVCKYVCVCVYGFSFDSLAIYYIALCLRCSHTYFTSAPLIHTANIFFELYCVPAIPYIYARVCACVFCSAIRNHKMYMHGCVYVKWTIHTLTHTYYQRGTEERERREKIILKLNQQTQNEKYAGHTHRVGSSRVKNDAKSVVTGCVVLCCVCACVHVYVCGCFAVAAATTAPNQFVQKCGNFASFIPYSPSILCFKSMTNRHFTSLHQNKNVH